MAGKKILVVEDDTDIREIISFYLEEEGFSVATLPNANDIVTITKREKPDLITMDIKLPGIDGPRAIGLLKEDAETASIPVLIISVIAKDPKVQRLSASGYIAKPFEKDELVNNVQYILTHPPGTQKGQKVLVVDDEPDVVDIIANHLESRGFIPVKAFNGKEAIQKAAEEKPDLIVLDIRMPQLDGFEVISVLNQNRQTWSIPIIVLSGVVISESDKQKGSRKGVVRFLSKPFEAQKLMEEVQRALCEKKKS